MIVYRVYAEHDGNELPDIGPTAGEWGSHEFRPTLDAAMQLARSWVKSMRDDYRERLEDWDPDDPRTLLTKQWLEYPVQVFKIEIDHSRRGLCDILNGPDSGDLLWSSAAEASK